MGKSDVVDGKKRCSKCQEMKPTECFFKSNTTKSGLDSWCKECKAKHNRKYKGNPPRKPIVDGKKHCSKCDQWRSLEFFAKDRSAATGYSYWCKYCTGTKNPNTPGRPSLKPIIDGKKQCTRCNEWKPIEEFEKHKKSNQGRSGRCKDCATKRTTQWVGGTIENYLTRLVKSNRSNRKFRTEKRNKRGKRPADFWTESCIAFEFLMELWKEQNGRCAITGIEMTHLAGEGRTQTNVSIDRIDSSIGYVEGNIQLVCKIVNVMKSELSLADLKLWCKRILTGLPEPD
jgi:hypothetical protein